MDPSTIDRLALELRDANVNGERYRPFPPDVCALGVDDAYAVQDRFNALMSAEGIGEARGYKIALTSAAMQAFVNVSEPLAGVLFESRIMPSPARLSLARYQQIGVEFEVTVRMGADLPAGDAPHTRESVADAVASCAASYELVEHRRVDFDQINAFNLVAENAWNAGLVLGEERRDWRALDLENGTTRLWIDGEPAGEGRTGDALGNPLEAVAWLANLLNRRGRQLERGMLVMTGSSITTKFPSPGEHYRFEIDGLNGVEIRWSS